MSNSKITLDDVLRFVEKTNGGPASAQVTINRVRITVGSAYIVDRQRDNGDDPAIVAANAVLASDAKLYLAEREREFRAAETASVRASSELTAAQALVDSLRAAVEASQ